MSTIEFTFDQYNNWCSSIIPDSSDTNMYNKITLDQYKEFKHYYVVDALKGLRFGQAFCNKFGISNASPLYHFKSQVLCERWIIENYLIK